MENNSSGEVKTIWAKVIKENMVRVSGSQCVYRLNDKKNNSVEIQLFTRNLAANSQRHRRPAKTEVPVAQTNVTLDVSRADYLVVNRHSTVMKYKQYIPWNKIVEIVFRDA